jgi:predicted Zn-dependent peptidase
MTNDQLEQAIGELGTPPTRWTRSSFSPTRFDRDGQFARSLALMGDMLMHPSFPTDAVDRRKAASSRRAARGGNRVHTRLRIFNARVWRDASVRASRDSSERQHHHARRYRGLSEQNVRPRDLTLIIVGDVSADAVIPAVTKVFGGQRTGQRVVVNVRPRHRSRRRSTCTTALVRREYCVHRAGGPTRGADAYALSDGSAFGGGGGSRLSLSLREQRRLTYSVVHAVLAGPSDPSSIMGSSNVDAAKADSAILVWMGEGISRTASASRRRADVCAVHYRRRSGHPAGDDRRDTIV